MNTEYTEEEIAEFRMLVALSESRIQTDRIKSRIMMPAFVNRVGKEKCDAMWEIVKNE